MAKISDIPNARHRAIAELWQQGSWTLKEIADEMGYESKNSKLIVARILRRLREQGYEIRRGNVA